MKKKLLALVLSGAMVLSLGNSAAAADIPKSTKGLVRLVTVYADSGIGKYSAYGQTASSGQPNITVSSTYVKIEKVTGDKVVLTAEKSGGSIAAVHFNATSSYVSWSITSTHKAKYKTESWKAKTQASYY